MSFWSPHIHLIMTAIHIFAAVLGLDGFHLFYSAACGRVDAPKPDPKAKKVEVIMHVVAFSSGCVAAYLGITIGG